jgi:cyclophilin family peptidyl-prolyl cis-trans isomerase
LAPNASYEIVVSTNCGSFTIRLEPDSAPHAAASFAALARGGYFNRTVFYRIVPGVMIEAGDPTATGRGGPGYKTIDAPPRMPLYRRGVVAMASDGRPGEAGSRFVIVTGTQVRMPARGPIVGQVVQGLDVVDQIGALGGGSDLPTQVENTSGVPSQVVEIEHAQLVTS